MTDTRRAALEEALDQAYRAEATFESAIAAFGPVPPFVGLVEEERRHADTLLQIFERHGLEARPNRWRGRISKPGSVREACSAAAAVEEARLAMYDRLISAVDDPEVAATFRALRDTARTGHLPELERCTDRTHHLDSV